MSPRKRQNCTHTAKTPYFCKFCQKNYSSLASLKSHFRTHTGEKPYSCDLCQKTFTNFVNLNCHRRIHTGEKPFSCDNCQKAFTFESGLKIHSRVHTRVKLFSCEICQEKFPYASGLKIHYRSVHKRVKQYICEVCKKKFISKSTLRLHQTVHTVEKPPSSSEEHNIARQKDTHGKSEIYVQCDDIDMGTCKVEKPQSSVEHKDTLSTNKLHVQYASANVCCFCPRVFKKKQYIFTHILQCHKDQDFPIFI